MIPVILQDWDCFGPGPGHKAELQWLASGYRSPSTDISISRCQTCGLLYHVHRYELSDWSAGGDYSDETTIWTPLDPDEVGAAQQNSNYKPRSEKSHRHDTGWRAG